MAVLASSKVALSLSSDGGRQFPQDLAGGRLLQAVAFGLHPAQLCHETRRDADVEEGEIQI